MNQYKAFYRQQRIEVEASTLYAARKLAGAMFQKRFPRSKLNVGELAIVLCGKDGKAVQFSPAAL